MILESLREQEKAKMFQNISCSYFVYPVKIRNYFKCFLKHLKSVKYDGLCIEGELLLKVR